MAGLPPSVMPKVQMYPVEDFLLPVLRDALPGLDIDSEIEAMQRFPFVLVRRGDTWGDWTGDPRFIDVAMIYVHCYTSDPDGDQDCAYLSEAVRVALYEAYNSQVIVPGVGHMCKLDMLSAPRRSTDWAPSVGPVQYADLPSGTHRYETRYDIAIRRPISTP